MKVQENRRKENRKRGSLGRLLVSWLAAMVIQVPIYLALGVEFVKSPFVTVLVLWIVITAAVVVLLDEMEMTRNRQRSSRRKSSDLLLQEM